jgi:hypothetical protein
MQQQRPVKALDISIESVFTRQQRRQPQVLPPARSRDRSGKAPCTKGHSGLPLIAPCKLRLTAFAGIMADWGALGAIQSETMLGTPDSHRDTATTGPRWQRRRGSAVPPHPRLLAWRGAPAGRKGNSAVSLGALGARKARLPGPRAGARAARAGANGARTGRALPYCAAQRALQGTACPPRRAVGSHSTVQLGPEKCQALALNPQLGPTLRGPRSARKFATVGTTHGQCRSVRALLGLQRAPADA